MIIKQIIHLPLHFWQFDHAQAKNILNVDIRYHNLITFLNLYLEKGGGLVPLIPSPGCAGATTIANINGDITEP